MVLIDGREFTAHARKGAAEPHGLPGRRCRGDPARDCHATPPCPARRPFLRGRRNQRDTQPGGGSDAPALAVPRGFSVQLNTRYTEVMSRWARMAAFLSFGVAVATTASAAVPVAESDAD